MGKIRRVSLELENFRTIKDRQKIEFLPNGLVLIRSWNGDHRCSSGGGKSTLFMASSATLDIAPYPLTELQSWLTKDPLKVTQVFDSEEHGRVEVTRGARGTSLKIGDAKPITSSGEVREKLSRIIGLPDGILAALTYCVQQDPLDFLTLPNAAKQEFLSQLLDTKRFEDAAEKASKRASELATTLSGAKLLLEAAESQRAAAEAAAVATPEQDPILLATAVDEAEQLLAQLVEQREAIKKMYQPDLIAQARASFETPGPITIRQEVLKINLTSLAADLELARGKKVETTPAQVQNEQRLAVGRTKLKEVQAADQLALQAYVQENQRLDKLLGELRAKFAQLPTWTKQLEKLKREIKALEDNKCPTCSQQWLDARAQIASRQTEVSKLEEQIRGNVDDIQKFTGLEAEKMALRYAPNPLIAQIQNGIQILEMRIQEETTKQQQAIRDAVTEVQQKIQLVKAELAGTETDVERARSAHCSKAEQQQRSSLQAVNAAGQAVSDQQQKTMGLKADLERVIQNNAWIRRNAVEKQKALEQAQILVGVRKGSVVVVDAEMRAEQDFAKMVGRDGFLGLIFEEVLAEISAETNIFLGQIKNTESMTLEFRSEMGARREIRPVVTIDGHEAPLKSGSSGGMYSVVRLAVKLAVRNVICRRTGSFPMWLDLDEPFDGLDTAPKECCMEILTRAAQDNLILVVDHGTEFKQLFDQKIHLLRKNGATTVVDEATFEKEVLSCS